MPGNLSFFPSQSRGLHSNTQESQGLMTNTKNTHTHNLTACVHTLNVMATTAALQLVESRQRTLGPNSPLCEKGFCLLDREYIGVKVKRRKELGFSSGVSNSTSARFCWSLLLAKGLQAKLTPATTCLRSTDPEAASSPPAAF